MAIDTNEGQGAQGNDGGNGAAGAAGAADNKGAQGQQGDPNTGTKNTADPNQRGDKPGPNAGFTYKEDRSKWIPPHRFQEVNSKLEKLTPLEAENKRLADQVKALAGVAPVDPDAEKTESIKAKMFEMFPWVKKFSDLSSEQLDRVLNAADQVDAAQQFVTQGYSKHAKTMLTSLVDEVTSLSGDLTDRAQMRLKTAFSNMIEQEVEKSEQSGDITPLLQRYIDGDEKLVQDFANEWNEDFGKPIRRQITAQEVNTARRVPNSQGRTQVTTVKRPEAFKTLDDRIAHMADTVKQHVTFDR